MSHTRYQAISLDVGHQQGLCKHEGSSCCTFAVSFNGLPTLVDMRERKVQARFLCQGRINHDPENYKPLWVPAQLVIYEGPKPMFSVLFDDIHHRYRHIMDLEPVPLPCRPSLSWLHDV